MASRKARCSPLALEDSAASAGAGTCFSTRALRDLAARWNDTFAERSIPGVATARASDLWTALRERIVGSGVCGKGSTEACWVEAAVSPLRDAALAATVFVPPKPASWLKNPTAWLSSVDIDRVMKQYEAVVANRFRWLGSLPRDFVAPHPAGGCVVDAMCQLDVRAELAKGVRSFGAAFNHDLHTQGGSHWVAMFVGMDPAAPLYGVHFSNSVGRPPMREFREWCERMALEVGEATGVPCPFKVNRVARQRYNTECGMFAIYAVVRCLQTFRGQDARGRKLGRPPPTWEELCDEPVRDRDMVEKRDEFFHQRGGARLPQKSKSS